MRHRHQSRRAIHLRPEVVTIPGFRRARVQAHPDSQRPRLPPRFLAKRDLGVDRRDHGIVRGAERGVRAVATHLHDVPTVGVDHLAKNLVVTRQRDLHRVRKVLPQTRRISQIGEQKRHRAVRQASHAVKCPI